MFVSTFDLRTLCEFELACFRAVSAPGERYPPRPIDEYATACHEAYESVFYDAQRRRALWFATPGSAFVVPPPVGLHLWLRPAVMPRRPAVPPRRFRSLRRKPRRYFGKIY